MSRRDPLPEPSDLRPRRFGHLRREGLTRYELDGELWSRPYRGLRMWSALPDLHPTLRAAAAAALLPEGAAVAGWAAAWAHGTEECDGLRFTSGGPQPLPVSVIVPPPAGIRPRDGLRVVRGRLLPGDTTRVGSLAVTTVTRTAFDLARWSAPGDAVAALDAMTREGILDLEDLATLCRDRPRWPGVVRARRAVRLAHPGAESPGETRLRLAAVGAGLTRLLVQPSVLGPDGRFVARPDLLDDEAGVAFEYDGAGHRDPRQQDRDRRRRHRMEDLGLVVREVVSSDLGPGLGMWMRDQRTTALRQSRTRRWTAVASRYDREVRGLGGGLAARTSGSPRL